MKLPVSIVRAGAALTALSGMAAATTLDFTEIYATVGNSTNLIFWVIGLFLDGISALVPKMFSPIILLSILGAIVLVVGVLPLLIGVIVYAFQHALHGKGKRSFK
jgi:hypothetical protein